MSKKLFDYNFSKDICLHSVNWVALASRHPMATTLNEILNIIQDFGSVLDWNLENGYLIALTYPISSNFSEDPADVRD